MARILMHTLLFPPDANSNAYMFADLATELKDLGHEIVVLTTTPHYAVEKESLLHQPLRAVRGQWLWRSDYRSIACFHIAVPQKKGGIVTRIKTAIRFHCLGLIATMDSEFKCDIVFSQSPPLTIGLLSAWMARKHGAKSIYVAQDIFPDGLIQQGRIKNSFIIWLLRILERSVYKHSDAVCSISDGLVRVLSTRVPKSTLLCTIPNFANSTIYHPLPRENDFAREHSLNDMFVISYIGNLGNAQDFSPVLSSADVCRDLPIKFLLIGSGIKEKLLAAEIARKELDNVILMSYQPRELTPMINAASDLCLVLLSPHVRNFSFPSKIYSLMACGKPILLYGCPEADIARFVRDTGIGWVVENGDIDGFVKTLRHLYNHRTELEECAKRALVSMQEHYTEKVVSRQYNELIHSLMVSK